MLEITRAVFLTVFHLIDVLSAFMAGIIFYLVIKDRASERSQSSAVDYDKRHEAAERNIASNTATRAIQAGITVGGFLFVGLLASFFQSDSSPFSRHAVHIIMALVWTVSSLFLGLVNIFTVPISMLTQNFVASPAFSNLLLFQSITLLGAFIRLTILITKTLFPNFSS